MLRNIWLDLPRKKLYILPALLFPTVGLLQQKVSDKGEVTMPASIYFLILMLCAASWTDWRHRRIPNALLLTSFFAALLLNSLTLGVNGFLSTLMGTIVGLGLLLAPYLLGGIGAGDVKLLMVIGGFVGAKPVIYSFLCGAIAGGIISLGIYLYNGLCHKKISTLPYGIPLSLGTVTYLFFGTGRL